MGLNKKQKKQLEAARNKLNKTRQVLAAAKQQADDPDETPQLEAQIAALEQEIRDLKAS